MPIPNKYLGCGCGLVFCRNLWLNNGKHGQGTHCTKMCADSLAENTPNLSAQFVSLSPKVLDFNDKRLHWVSVVGAQSHYELTWRALDDFWTFGGWWTSSITSEKMARLLAFSTGVAVAWLWLWSLLFAAAAARWAASKSSLLLPTPGKLKLWDF